MRLYIIRHADPDYPNNTITPGGHLEAQALAKRLDSHGLDLIYSSPLPRAHITAQYTADLLHKPVQIEEWAAELGWKIEQDPYTRLSAWDLPGELFRAEASNYGQETWHETPVIEKLALREKFDLIKQHGDEFLARHGYERDGGLYRRIKPNRDKVALFCHNGLGLAWFAHLLEIPLPLIWSGFWMPPSSVTTILFDERSEEFAIPRCIGFGDVSHLYAAGLAVQPRGIITNFD
ncbi:MAG: histidine phosphatase family protein [Abitibacteriaceae bacterium]|nr:histidine phosphatase family protein [Abditibacteriaceae bacterium]